MPLIRCPACGGRDPAMKDCGRCGGSGTIWQEPPKKK